MQVVDFFAVGNWLQKGYFLQLVKLMRGECSLQARLFDYYELLPS
jgi:hypothetical protein